MASSVTSRASLGSGSLRVLVHHAGQQHGIERPPVDADAHRLAVLDGHFDHGAEIVVGLAADVEVAGIDAVLGQRAGALRILLQKDVAVIVEVADDGDAHAELLQRIDDPGHRGGGLLGIHGDAHQFRAGARQRHHLVDGGRRVGGIGVGHGLHDDGMVAPDLDTSNVHHGRLPAGFYSHWFPSTGKNHYSRRSRLFSRSPQAGIQPRLESAGSRGSLFLGVSPWSTRAARAASYHKSDPGIQFMKSLTLFIGLFCASFAWAQPANQSGIAHVAFRVADLDAARAFYNKLGFEQFFAMKQGDRTTEAFLKINDHQFIELYPRTDPSQPLGLMHVCYESSDLEALHADLAKRGLAVSDVRKAGAGNLLMTMKDPEGADHRVHAVHARIAAFPGPRQHLGAQARGAIDGRRNRSGARCRGHSRLLPR